MKHRRRMWPGLLLMLMVAAVIIGGTVLVYVRNT